MKPIYNPYQCPRCLDMVFSYFGDEVHRWCKAKQMPIEDFEGIIGTTMCDVFNKAKKGRISKAKYLDQAKYSARYPE